jgi:hypothetical protein
MNLLKRLARLESRVLPDGVVLVMKSGAKRVMLADSIVKVYQAVLERAEEWHKLGRSFPLPDTELQSIPPLPEILDTVSIDRDIVAKFPQIPTAPVVASIKLLAARRPREVSRDDNGEFMMLPSVAGPIKICFVTPNPERLPVQ